MTKNISKILTKFVASMLAACFLASFASAQVMTSSNYQIERDSVNVGGGVSSSANLGLEDTAGETGTGRSTSGSFRTDAGYQQVDGTTTPDTTAPSAPTGLSASGLSSGTIGLVWNASTDNVSVYRYKVFRDGTFIATTTGTTYTDSGLSASTAYSYTVTVVDFALNESLHSATSSATTLPADVTDPDGGSQSGGTVGIYDVRTYAGTDFINVRWKTGYAADSQVFWGLTRNYEKGSLSDVVRTHDHSMRIEGLDHGRNYYVMIVSIDAGGFRGIEEIRVRTLRGSDTEPPTNVSDFTAVSRDGGIGLSWRNPRDLDFESVRIVRSEEFFPGSASEGDVVYEGPAEQFLDADVQDGTIYFYTAFVKDASGNYSSGAVANATAGRDVVENPFDSLPSAPSVHPKIAKLTLADFEFVQEGRETLIVGDDRIYINGMKPLKIRLDYGKVPEVLKTIAVTFVQPNDPSKQFTFLMKIDADKEGYEAVVAPLNVAGVYRVKIAIVDHKNRGLKKIEGNMMAMVSQSLDADDASPEGLAVALMIQVAKALSLIFLIVLLAFSVYDMRKKAKVSARKMTA